MVYKSPSSENTSDQKQVQKTVFKSKTVKDSISKMKIQYQSNIYLLMYFVGVNFHHQNICETFFEGLFGRFGYEEHGLFDRFSYHENMCLI